MKMSSSSSARRDREVDQHPEEHGRFSEMRSIVASNATERCCLAVRARQRPSNMSSAEARRTTMPAQRNSPFAARARAAVTEHAEDGESCSRHAEAPRGAQQLR